MANTCVQCQHRMQQSVCSANTTNFHFPMFTCIQRCLVLAPVFLVLPLHKVECIYRYDPPPPRLYGFATTFCAQVLVDGSGASRTFWSLVSK